jgi:hypothetical protein
MVNRRRETNLKWALSLKPGDIINDCTAFNVRIISIDPDIRRTGHGWYIMNVDFQVSPFGGFCSLNHCGIEPELPRDKIEHDWLEYTEQDISSGRLARWFGNDQKKLEEEMIFLSKRIDALKSGKHITNDHGMILKEYCRYPDSFKE